ncbi:unnamed protein product [Effrenium voratum]|nr:unnamed protein product [Effrenium voratum]
MDLPPAKRHKSSREEERPLSRIERSRDPRDLYKLPMRQRKEQAVKAEKAALVARLLEAKERSGKSFDELAKGLGLTNGYTANLFFNQAQLKAPAAAKLKELVPGISAEDLQRMQRPPMRSFDPAILQEPNVYRTYEAVTHYGEAIKALVNEQCGDGIMSAIDFYLDVGTTVGKKGEKRVVITMNGKFLPHVEQMAADNTVPGPRE